MTFLDAQITELRSLIDPTNPEGSDFRVILPRSVIDAITDPDTGEVLSDILRDILMDLNYHTSNDDIHITPGWETIINTLIAELVARDILTAEDRVRWDQAAIDAAAALALAQLNAGKITDMNGRLSQIEYSLFHQVTANPFLITFGSLDGIVMTRGILNEQYQRVEW